MTELRELCRKDGLEDVGKKADLAQRLILHGHSQGKRKREEELETSVRSKLDCPVCFELMLPPISQCREGHAVCGSCCKRLLRSAGPKCPTCRCVLASPVARALQLELVAATVQLTCKWQGCGHVCPYSDFAHHINTCVCRHVNCPVSGATCWSGAGSDLRAHLEEKHGFPGFEMTADASGRSVIVHNLAGCEHLKKSHSWRRTVTSVQGPSFAWRLWNRGGKEPYLFAVQRLGRDGPDDSKWTCTLRMAGEGEQLACQCIVPDIDAASDIFEEENRELTKCKGKVFVITLDQMKAFRHKGARGARLRPILTLAAQGPRTI